MIPILINKIDKHPLSKYPWYLDKSTGYIKAPLRSKKHKLIHRKSVIYLHRLILSEPKGYVDHINGNKLDNRRKNLRIVNSLQNTLNRKVQSNNKLQIKGVDFQRNRFRVVKVLNGKQKHIGVFKTLKEAEIASIKADKQFFKMYSRFAND